MTKSTFNKKKILLTSKLNLNVMKKLVSRSQWPRGLRRGSAAVRLMGLGVRIPLGAWISVSCECCVLSGRGLCVGLTTRLQNLRLGFLFQLLAY
jgi:hypothetical protein